MRKLTVPAALVALTLLTAGCGGEKQISQKEVEKEVKTELTKKVGTAPKRIDCPDDLPATKGAKMTCVLVAPDDSEVDVDVDVTSTDGDRARFDIQVGTEVRRKK